jgi:hypothetical protein
MYPNVVYSLKILCALFVAPFCLILVSHWSLNYLYSFAFLEHCVVGIIQYVASTDWLLSLSNVHLGFLCVFSWLGRSFLFWWRTFFFLTVYLSTHLLTDMLIVSKFWWVWIKLLWMPCAGFLCGYKFATYQGAQFFVLSLFCPV